ncbi:MAG: outer membrane beta-barrel protein [Thiothrix litoralis]
MKKLLVVNAGLVALLGSGMAEAGYSPYYGGAGLGATGNNGNESQFCPACDGSQFKMRNDKGDNRGYKVYGGTNLTQNLGVEVDYTDLGKTYDADMYRPTLDGRAERAHAWQQTRGVGVSAKVNRRITRKTSVYGKAGAFAWENKNQMDYTNLDGISETYKTKDRGVSPRLGMGIEHEITDHMSIRVGWDRTFNNGKGNQFLHLDENKNYADLRSVKTDTEMVYVGATFNF